MTDVFVFLGGTIENSNVNVLMPFTAHPKSLFQNLWTSNKVRIMTEDTAVAIESRSGLGNVLVATKAFKPGENYVILMKSQRGTPS